MESKKKRREIREVSFKIIHMIYPVKKSTCQIQRNNFSCHYVNLFWKDIERFIRDHVGLFSFIFLYVERDFAGKGIFLLNLFILFGKIHLHKAELTREKKPKGHARGCQRDSFRNITVFLIATSLYFAFAQMSKRYLSLTLTAYASMQH